MSLGWRTLSGEDFLAAMRRAHAGEDPDTIYAGWCADSHVERFD